MKSPDAPINEDEEFKMAVELSFWHRVYMYLSGRGYQRNACGQMATHIDRLFDEYSMTKELEATVIEDNLRIAELEAERDAAYNRGLERAAEIADSMFMDSDIAKAIRKEINND